MKYILILYVCSFVNVSKPICSESMVVGLEFDNYKDCILQGYKSSHNTLKELYGERIEEEKTYLTLLKYLRQKPNNKNTDSAIKQIEKALLKLDFY